jgi:hypothetical protein
MVEGRVKAPLVDLRLLRNGVLVGATVAILIVAGAINALMYLLSLYFQNPAAFGYSALEAGLATLPAAAAMIAVTPLITPLAVKIGAGRAVALGFAVATLGSGILIFVGASWTYVAFVVPLVLIAVGLGVANGPASSASTSSVDARDTGAASGISNMARYVGGSLAVARAAHHLRLGHEQPPAGRGDSGRCPRRRALARGDLPDAVLRCRPSADRCDETIQGTPTTSRRPRSGRRLDHPHDPRPAGGVAQCAAGSPIRAHRSASRSCSSSATAR